jgi:hypothetical protein
VIVAPFIDVAVAAHKAGVTKVGLVANTTLQVQVSSLITQANCAEVVAANCDNGLVVNASQPQGKVTQEQVSSQSACNTFHTVSQVDNTAVHSGVQPHQAGVLKAPLQSKYSVLVQDSFGKNQCFNVVALFVVISVVVIVASEIV